MINWFLRKFPKNKISLELEKLLFSDEQIMIQETARQFSWENLLPYASEWDQKSHFPKETIKNAAELGFGGIYVSEEFGGSGLGYFESSIIFQELSYGCISSAAYISIHNMVNGLMYRHGS